MIDRHGAVPLYHQIFLHFRDEIINGQRPFGSSMPTEQEISAMFKVSRITTRRVLSELASQHYVERRRHVGTRVTFRSPVAPIEANVDQAVEALMALGHGTGVSVVEMVTDEAPPTVANMLRLQPGEQVIRVVRIRHLGGKPLGHVVNFMPIPIGTGITPDALTHTPLLRLLEDAGHKAARAKQTIGARQASVDFANSLDIDPNAALVRISRTVYDREDCPFLLTFAHYRSDRFVIGVDLEGSDLSA